MRRTERREQLLGKAREVFAQRGYHATKIDDIVAHANVARGTFYLHFGDKRAIFEQLVDAFLADLGRAIVRIHPGLDVPPLHQLRDNIQRILGLGLSDPCMTKILLEDAVGLDAAFDEKVRSFYATLEALLRASLGEGQKLGLVRGGDCGVMGALALGAIKEILLQAAQGRASSDLTRLTDEVMRFIAVGLLEPGTVMAAALPTQQRPSAAE